MPASFPTMEAIRDLESRQEEVLRKLEDLEGQIAVALAAFGDQQLLKAAEMPGANPGLHEAPQSWVAKAA